MSIELSVGDLLVTKGWEDEIIEIVQYVGETGYLLYTMTECLKYHKERFIKKWDSLPYSTRVVRISTVEHGDVINRLAKSLQADKAVV